MYQEKKLKPYPKKKKTHFLQKDFSEHLKDAFRCLKISIRIILLQHILMGFWKLLSKKLKKKIVNIKIF